MCRRTRDVRRELLPTDSSPQMHIRTVCYVSDHSLCVRVASTCLWPFSIAIQFKVKSEMKWSLKCDVLYSTWGREG